MNERGRVLEQVRLKNDPQTLLNYVNALPARSKIALEATGNWYYFYYFYELLEDKSLDVYLAHPLKTRAIAEARIKTDKIDSSILAHLLSADLLPSSYIPPREIREVLRYRASIVSLRTSIKNKVHVILSKNGINIEFSDIFGKKAVKALKSLNLRACYKQGIDGYIRLVETLNGLIEEVTETIKGVVEDNPQAKLLTTISGISYYSALLIISEIGDVYRFPSEGDPVLMQG